MEIIFTFFTLHVGRKSVHLEISSREKNMAGLKSAKRSLSSSILEFKLDELRKELSSVQGGIFPHSILSSQQIGMISSQKPNSTKQAGFIVTIPLVLSSNPHCVSIMYSFVRQKIMYYFVKVLACAFNLVIFKQGKQEEHLLLAVK